MLDHKHYPVQRKMELKLGIPQYRVKGYPAEGIVSIALL